MKAILRKLFIWSPFFILLFYVFNFQTANSRSAQPNAGHVKDPVNNLSCARSGCHSSFAFINASRANVTIGTSLANQVPLNGFQYATGTSYIIQFSITSTAARYGFQMSALTATNTNAGTFSTSLSPATTSIGTLGGISYIGHRDANTTSSWNFNWTSPATNAGNITFYTAVNKSNNSSSSLGDSIFHQTFVATAPQLSANAGNDVTVCPNTATSLQATATNAGATSTYAWAPSTGLSCTTCANPTATVSGNTTYTVTITSAGQTASDAVSVNTFTTSVPFINATSNTVCPGNSVTLSSSGFSGYAWSTGANTNSTTINAAGTYSLTATDVNGCTTSNSAVIQQGQSPLPVISSSAPYLCNGNSVTLSAGSFSGYVWSTNAITPVINVSSAGNYRVTVTNSSGCSAAASYTLSSYSSPAANVNANGPLTFCSGESVTLTANSGTDYAYKWSTGATTQAITILQSGNYQVTVYNPCDSAVSLIQQVTVNAVPVAQLSPSNSVLLCNGASQTLRAAPSGSGYEWLKDGLVIAGEVSDSLTVNDAGNYSVVVANGNCRDTSQAVSVSAAGTGNAVVNINASKNFYCVGDTITLDAGTGFTTYSWAPVNSFSTTAQITNAGTYIVSVTLNNGQCNSTGADTINIAAGADVSIPQLSYDTTTCEGDTITITVAPNTYTNYLWSNGTSSPSLTAITGSYSVTVSEVGLCGTATAGINANGIPLPDATFTITSDLLTANLNGAAYQWYLNGTAISGATSNTYTVVENGSYSLQVIRNGCSNVSLAQQVITDGITLFDSGVGVIFYPNPFNRQLSVEVSSETEEEFSLEIKTLDGRVVRPLRQFITNENVLRFIEDLNDLPKGVYLITLYTKRSFKTVRIIKADS